MHIYPLSFLPILHVCTVLSHYRVESRTESLLCWCIHVYSVSIQISSPANVNNSRKRGGVRIVYVYVYMLAGRALCLECKVPWVRVPPEAAHFFLWKSDCLGCAVLLCFVSCLTFACFFLPPPSSLNNMYTVIHLYIAL